MTASVFMFMFMLAMLMWLMHKVMVAYLWNASFSLRCLAILDRHDDIARARPKCALMVLPSSVTAAIFIEMGSVQSKLNTVPAGQG